jgi:flagellar motor switch protein FliN/FliY
MKTKDQSIGVVGQAQSQAAASLSLDAALLRDVPVQLQATLGEASMVIETLLALRAGSIVKLDLKVNDLIDLRLNNALVARGEIVAVDDHFGVRIVEIAQT